MSEDWRGGSLTITRIRDGALIAFVFCRKTPSLLDTRIVAITGDRFQELGFELLSDGGLRLTRYGIGGANTRVFCALRILSYGL